MTQRRRDPMPSHAPEGVQWHEGMLLAPQHFQQEARRLEALINLGVRAAAPYVWGVWTLEIDSPLLNQNLLRVTHVEAILPDGLPVAHPRPADPELEFDCTPFLAELAEAPMTLHLAVPVNSDSAAVNGANRRYRSVDEDQALDINLGENPISVPRLRPAPVLVPSKDPKVSPGVGYASIPIAKIQVTDGQLKCIEFQPPVIRVSHSTLLHARATSTLQLLRDKAGGLAERVRQAAAGEVVEVLKTPEALPSLFAPIPRLEAVLNDELTAPNTLFLELCSVLGAVSGMEPTKAPPSPPVYVHEDPLPAFDALHHLIEQALSRLSGARRLIPFDAKGDGVFQLPAERIENLPDKFRIVLIGPASDSASRTVLWGVEATIASPAEVEAARLNRVRGAARQPVERADVMDFAIPPKGVVFDVTLEQRYLRAGQAIEISHPEGSGSQGEPVRVALVAAEGASGESPQTLPPRPRLKPPSEAPT